MVRVCSHGFAFAKRFWFSFLCFTKSWVETLLSPVQVGQFGVLFVMRLIASISENTK